MGGASCKQTQPCHSGPRGYAPSVVLIGLPSNAHPTSKVQQQAELDVEQEKAPTQTNEQRRGEGSSLSTARLTPTGPKPNAAAGYPRTKLA
mmetsp:Transcript_51931/g.100347  ORF Transcript_51931/g.100347 Transcript_51931/m.100347 type:complete len:91 (+) Transcript_51931:308-580(+)